MKPLAPTPAPRDSALLQTEDTDYELVHNSVWIGSGPFSIHIIRTGEGVIADIYKRSAEMDSCLAGAYAYDDEVTA